MKSNPQPSADTAGVAPAVLAGLATCFVLATAVLALFSLWSGSGSPLAGIDGSPVQSPVDLGPRRGAYLALLAALAAAGLLLALIHRGAPGSGRSGATARRIPAVYAVWALLVGLVVLWLATLATLSLHSWTILFADRYGLLTLASERPYLAATVASTGIVCAFLRFGRRISAKRWWLLLIAYAAVVTIPPLAAPISLDDVAPGTVALVEWHFDEMFHPLPAMIRSVGYDYPGYVLLPNVLLAGLQRATGAWSFAADVRLLQAANLLWLALVLLACFLWRRDAVVIAAVTLLLVLPWTSTVHQSIFFPNQSGLRYLMFPCAVIAIVLAGRSVPRRAALPFGILSGTAILWNPETGIAVAAGLAVFLAARMERLRPGEVAASAAAFAAGLLGAALLFVLVYRALLGSWLRPGDLSAYLWSRTSAISGALPGYFDPLFLVILACAIYFILRAAIQRAQGPLSPHDAGMAALAAIIVVWSVYFIQRPHIWNLWSYLFPFGILLGESVFRFKLGRAGSEARSERELVLLAILVLFVLPTLLIGQLAVVRAAIRTVEPAPEEKGGTTVLSGVRMPAADAEAIQARAAYLAAVPDDARIFTGDGWLLDKASGDGLRYRSFDRTFTFSTRERYLKLLASVRSDAPAVLLFDDPATLAKDAVPARLFTQLQKDLSDRYRLEEVRSGWSIWRRIAP